ncbi:serine/threonine protein kinase [Sandaracinus amylolyticus]|uniref:non-specific serine/threonine protein kinase n=1 Tax=Sandaracinus amylolyticus TaxID=927083 RepID=A0A0F6SGN8_9BACT|nr:serine/threonine protein kinase [Sandaracinus amylolyticus]
MAGVGERDDRDATLDASLVDDESGPREKQHVAASADLVPGQLFAGRYLVEGLLGRGGMGSVWRVRDQMVGETVALKTLSLHDGSDRAIERFRREVRLARRITSPHVARTHDLGSQGGVHFLTMELIEGPSLSRLLEKERRLAHDRAARIAAQIADGLAAAHAAGVVHRDLKPDNVLIEARTSRVVVTDFGIARALDADAAQRTGGIVGTPLYMAPEQIAGRTVDARADLYALGLVLFELLTGEAAFAADTPIAAAVKRLQQPAPDPRSLVGLPDALADIVMRCLERDPSRRHPDAASLARALVEVAGTGAIVSLSNVSIASPTATPTANRSPVAPLLRGDRALAVVPFAYRGPSDQDWLAPGIGDELIDVLSRTRGLRVLGRGAVQHLDGSRDARDIGRSLSVDYVIDGTVQVAGPRLRVTVRLLDVATGVQQWSERFDSEVEDLFAIQEQVAQRIAESLRLSLHGVGAAGAISPEALELYVRARHRLRTANAVSPVETAEALERVIELAPDFAPAYASYATACVRAWFLPSPSSTRDWGAEAARAIERAVEHAPDLAETHYARAQIASQHGRYREAVGAVRTALSIAPTLPEAHQFLGMLQVEAGRAKEGLQRIDLALQLDPNLLFASLEKMRWNGQYGDLVVFDAIAEKWSDDPTKQPFLAQQLVRVGAFRRDEARIRRGIVLLEDLDIPSAPFMKLYARVMLGEREVQGGLAALRTVLDGKVSDRFRSLVHQLCAEAYGRLGDVPSMMEHVRGGAESVLVDLEWMDRCPLIEQARAQPEFAELRRKVRARCEQIWAA